MFPHRPAAVVCDMDGLLVDSERLERRAWQAAAAEHGIDMSDERFATFVGHPADEGERMLRGYFGAEFDVPAWRESCHRRLRAIMDLEGVPLRPGALEWLAFVAGHGLPVALATSSGPELVRDRLGPHLGAFAAVVTRADVARGKPHPDLYLEAARRLGVRPGECLALEDSPTGARSAIAAGMPVVLVPDLVQPTPEVAARVAGIHPSLDAVREAATRAWGAPPAPLA